MNQLTLLQTIILGIVQGLTEFLPISSSGHLVLLPHLLGWEMPAQDTFIFDVLVQVATLLAVIVYFWDDLWRIALAFGRGLVQRAPLAEADSRMGWYLILATIPAGVVGLLVKDQVEAAFASPRAAAGFLLLTAALLVIAERIGKRSRDEQTFTWVDALAMGAAQILAIFPGVSRSGSTIAGGMLRDLDRPTAARFSFLMSVPVMLAAGALALKDLLALPHLAQILPPFLAGFAAAAIVGYLSIRWLLRYLTRHSLYVFAAYCAALGLLVLVLG